MADKKPEVWMRGPVEGVEPYLQPVVHSLLQVKEEIEALLPAITDEMLWMRPGGAASIAFHLDHIGGATDRLCTYARGEMLSPEQLGFLKAVVYFALRRPDLAGPFRDYLKSLTPA